MSILALDIGGANLKAADGRGYVASRPFPLWRQPDELQNALSELIAESPPAERIVVTMTGELADCYRTKAEGVQAIVTAVRAAAENRSIGVYLTDGSIVDCEEACRRSSSAAATNWHALACFAGRFVPTGTALLLDVGSTTCDIIPLAAGRAVAAGVTDTQRLASGELVYTGVRRSPVCAVVTSLPYNGQPCPVAQELFATTWDAYLTLGHLAEEPRRRDTADGRPATIRAARDRLARMVCADRETFDEADARAAAESIQRAQLAKLGVAAQSVLARLDEQPAVVITSGEGEFLARDLIERLRLNVIVMSFAERFGPEISAVAPAHALAVIARELATNGSNR